MGGARRGFDDHRQRFLLSVDVAAEVARGRQPRENRARVMAPFMSWAMSAEAKDSRANLFEQNLKGTSGNLSRLRERFVRRNELCKN